MEFPQVQAGYYYSGFPNRIDVALRFLFLPWLASRQRGSHRQHGARCGAQDGFRHAAGQQPGQACPAMGAHDDQVPWYGFQVPAAGPATYKRIRSAP